MAHARNITFDKRVGQIVRKHKKLANGAVQQIGPDGLLTVRPRRTSLRMPWRGVVLILAILVLSKAALYAHLGALGYADKLSQLSQGSAIEQFGAWMMTPDFLTMELASRIAPLLG